MIYTSDGDPDCDPLAVTSGEAIVGITVDRPWIYYAPTRGYCGIDTIQIRITDAIPDSPDEAPTATGTNENHLLFPGYDLSR